MFSPFKASMIAAAAIVTAPALAGVPTNTITATTSAATAAVDSAPFVNDGIEARYKAKSNRYCLRPVTEAGRVRMARPLYQSECQSIEAWKADGLTIIHNR